MLHIVLVEPEIPQNTGNIVRTCACIGSTLHLVEPLGFRPTQRNLLRAGCDYWDKVTIKTWACIEDFLESMHENKMFLFTGRVSKSYTSVQYPHECYLLFGRESAGLPEWLLQKYEDCCVRIPMVPACRSLNLSNAVAVAAFEVLRQQGFSSLL